MSNEQGFAVLSQLRVLLQSDSLYSSSDCIFETFYFQLNLASKHEWYIAHRMQYWHILKAVMWSWYYDWAEKYKE